jgi:acetyl-CoA carboxylase carboxyl transferase subunit alpha
MPNEPSQARRELDAMETQLRELRQQMESKPDPEAQKRVDALSGLVGDLRADLSSREQTAWQRVKLARHPQRPYFLDYAGYLFEEFSEVHGDRGFADDPAIVCGMARFNGREVLAVGQQKGRNTKDNVLRNFGMPRPEGYRKAIRVMQFAAKFGRPIFTFLDTPGAWHGMDAEERGQGEAIARNLREMSRLGVPIVVTVIGEGGSGGALGLGVGNRVLILENAVYSVISPESCAAIVWRDSAQAELAAGALKLTAPDLLAQELVDEIVPEPHGGAQLNHRQAADLLKPVLERHLAELEKMSPEQLVNHRYEKFRKMGQFFEPEQVAHVG